MFGYSKLYVTILGKYIVEAPVPALVLVIGVILCIVGTLGMIGLYKFHENLLFTFSILLTVISLFDLSLGIVTMAMRGGTKSELEAVLKKGIDEYNTMNKSSVTEFMDMTQLHFNCCGTKDDTDWQRHIWYDSKNKPRSCCGETALTCTVDSKELRNQGCLEPIILWLDLLMLIAGIVLILLSSILTFSITLACCLTVGIQTAKVTTIGAKKPAKLPIAGNSKKVKTPPSSGRLSRIGKSRRESDKSQKSKKSGKSLAK